MKHYAHSIQGRPHEEWQGLEDHLNQTAELAECFANKFAPGWGRLAGMWHDAGKYQAAFQKRISDPEAHIKVDHSSVGALIASHSEALPLAFVIAGHHGGMPDRTELGARLKDKAKLLVEAREGGLPKKLEEEIVPPPVNFALQCPQVSLWTRLVFSSLVDADFLDTEKFYAGGVDRNQENQLCLAELKVKLDAYMAEKSATAGDTAMNQMRARVLAACRSGSSEEPGQFTLTVPTGGGKTLASLTFAIDHALRHGLQRVIVVIPFTSIIEQTVKVFREAMGEEAVIEHHTNVDPDKETRFNRLASENWDAPIVVTTNVQFFESLFSNRPSRCRKLHRIVGSAVVFDEVQTFPVHLLEPIKYLLSQLAKNYKTTTVFCTGTQPALFEGVREIVPEAAKNFELIRDRCEVIMPNGSIPLEWSDLATELETNRQALAIVHRRDDAQKLAELIGADCLHLSARMCPRHRSKILAKVKELLKDSAPCKLVATQLVEAGVDIDFPEVYRAFAGADSLAQAAGRCNREGLGNGRLHIFNAPTKPPKGILRTAEQVARTMLDLGKLDLKDPATFRDFFSRLYRLADQDGPAVMTAEKQMKFQEVAKLFRMIENHGEPVVAPYGDWQDKVEDVRQWGVSRQRMRWLQPFMVSLYRQEIDTLSNAGAIERIAETFWAVVPGFSRIYSDRWGFGWQGILAAEPEDLIA